MTTSALFTTPPGFVDWVQYDDAGRITLRGFASAPDYAYRRGPLGERLTTGTHSGDTHYVDIADPEAGEKPRPDLRGVTWDRTTIVVGETATLSGLPAGTTVTINGGDPLTVDDGALELLGEHAMTYTVVVEAFPHLPVTETIECVSA